MEERERRLIELLARHYPDVHDIQDATIKIKAAEITLLDYQEWLMEFAPASRLIDEIAHVAGRLPDNPTQLGLT